MTDKLEALSQPVFEIEVSGNTWLNCSEENLTPTERADFSDWPDGINKLYSQEYVTALLAENAELKSKIENPVVLVGNSKKSVMSIDDAVRRIKFAGFNVEVKKP